MFKTSENTDKLQKAIKKCNFGEITRNSISDAKLGSGNRNCVSLYVFNELKKNNVFLTTVSMFAEEKCGIGYAGVRSTIVHGPSNQWMEIIEFRDTTSGKLFRCIKQIFLESIGKKFDRTPFFSKMSLFIKKNHLLQFLGFPKITSGLEKKFPILEDVYMPEAHRNPFKNMMPDSPRFLFTQQFCISNGYDHWSFIEELKLVNPKNEKLFWEIFNLSGSTKRKL